jgi:uncharacterized protein (TIGR02996 family)
MNEEAALLATICAQRHDDRPRLVYADWLDDQGRCEQARFIRAQIAGEALDWLPFREPCIDWLVPFTSVLAGLPRPHVTYERGLVAGARVRAPRFLRLAHDLFRAWPLRAVQITELTGPGLYALWQLPELLQLETLDLSNNRLTADDLAGLAWCPFVCELRELILNHNPLVGQGFSLLRSCSTLPKLARLHLIGTGSDPHPLPDWLRQLSNLPALHTVIVD